MNLYNHKDEALRYYPLLFRSGHHVALGRVGLSNRDFARLGPLAARYTERDVYDFWAESTPCLMQRRTRKSLAGWPFIYGPRIPVPAQLSSETSPASVSTHVAAAVDAGRFGLGGTAN